jgi:hypothetical protein
LPLIPGVIEIVTSQMAATNTGLTIGKLAVLGWRGQPPTTNTYQGVRWISPSDWIPYQRTNFVTPAFPGYFSGHSTFSRSAAEVLAAITGTPFFPGGMGTYSNYVLAFEKGPSQPVTLQWATYYDAADQAGISRIWGGIHPPIDNLAGRRAGAQCGKGVWQLARRYWDGTIANSPTTLAVRKLGSGTHEVRCDTLRGLYYKVQSTPNITDPYTDEGGAVVAHDSYLARTNGTTDVRKFYRVVTTTTP